MTCRTLEDFYHIDGHTFEKQYKETLSGFRQWDQLEHADEWLLFPENIGPRLAIDESCCCSRRISVRVWLLTSPRSLAVSCTRS